VIKTPEDAIGAAACALARISTFRAENSHAGDCAWCGIDPKELCKEVNTFVTDSNNESLIRVFENRATMRTMESMWLG